MTDVSQASNALSTRDLEQPPCPLCDAAEHAPSKYAHGQFRIVRCTLCGLWFLSPRLVEAEMLRMYEASSYFAGGEGGYADYATQERSLKATFDRLLRTMDRLGMTGGALLDVGCGYGYLLRSARAYFESTAGTDFSEAAVQKAGDYGAVYHGGVNALPRDVMFDCITATHVIEHVYDPRDFVRQLFARLRPGGWLLAAVPDMGSHWRRVMGRRWPSFKYPEHVVYYDRGTLRRLLREASGSDILVDVPYPHAFPLDEVCAKLGLRAPRMLGGANVWLPATTVAVGVRRPS